MYPFWYIGSWVNASNVATYHGVGYLGVRRQMYINRYNGQKISFFFSEPNPCWRLGQQLNSENSTLFHRLISVIWPLKFHRFTWEIRAFKQFISRVECKDKRNGRCQAGAPGANKCQLKPLAPRGGPPPRCHLPYLPSLPGEHTSSGEF